MQSTIKIPEELARELDRLDGAEQTRRTAYTIDVLWRDVRRNKQRDALKLTAGTWNPADHPELAEGGAVYVERIRSEPDERFDTSVILDQLIEQGNVLACCPVNDTEVYAGLRAGEETKTAAFVDSWNTCQRPRRSRGSPVCCAGIGRRSVKPPPTR